MPTLPSTQATTTDIATQFPPQVVTTLTELFGNDLSQWRFIVDLFSETVEQDLINLDKAIRAGEDAQIVEAAHRIVGSARMLGHLQIGDTARVVERTAQSIGPYPERLAEMQAALSRLCTLVDAFQRQVSGCVWPDSSVAR